MFTTIRNFGEVTSYGGKMIKVKYSALIELECEVTNWAEMPKYKGKDVGND